MNMNERIATWNEEAQQCACGHQHRVVDMLIHLEAGAIQRLPGYLSEQGYRQVTVVYDRHTFRAAGSDVLSSIREAECMWMRSLYRRIARGYHCG